MINIILWLTEGGIHALSSRSSRHGPKENRQRCSQTLQPARIRKRVRQRDHGGGRTDARRILQLFRKQERSICRGVGLFLHRPKLEQHLEGRGNRSDSGADWAASPSRLSVSSALRKH